MGRPWKRGKRRLNCGLLIELGLSMAQSRLSMDASTRSFPAFEQFFGGFGADRYTGSYGCELD